MKYIYFKNSNGKRLCGIISNPKSNSIKELDTAIILCHGLGSNKDDALYITLQDKINALGLTTFRMDLLGHGESEGEFDDLTLTETIDDILCAKHELEKGGHRDVGFIGTSFGAVGGIMVASLEQFKFLVVISPPTHYDMSEMIKSSIYLLRELMKVNKATKKKKAHLNVRFFRDYGSYDSYDAAKKITVPVMIIHGNKDNIVPLAKSRELHKRIKGSKLKVIRDADHHYTTAQNKLVKEVMIFVNNYS